MNTIKLMGKIVFDPINLTKKHKKQAAWKRVAFIEFDGDICEYYQFFLKKRFNLILLKPIRSAHITIVNDSINDLTKKGEISKIDIENQWNSAKDKWNNQYVEVEINIDVRTNGKTWWMNLSNITEKNIKFIRAEVGLGDPYFKAHMTIGNAHPKYLEHSEYIHRTILRYEL